MIFKGHDTLDAIVPFPLHLERDIHPIPKGSDTLDAIETLIQQLEQAAQLGTKTVPVMLRLGCGIRIQSKSALGL